MSQQAKSAFSRRPWNNIEGNNISKQSKYTLITDSKSPSHLFVEKQLLYLANSLRTLTENHIISYPNDRLRKKKKGQRTCTIARRSLQPPHIFRPGERCDLFTSGTVDSSLGRFHCPNVRSSHRFNSVLGNLDKMTNHVMELLQPWYGQNDWWPISSCHLSWERLGASYFTYLARNL